MTAGIASTSPTSAVLHRTDTSLPYQPRPLTRGERSRREVFVFYSPKNQRITTIADAVQAALAIRFEFDPTLSNYVERPRRIQYTPKQQLDISFWTKCKKTGEERFHLLIPESGTVGSTSGTVSIRDKEKLDEAAARNGVILHYPTERELLAARTWLATGFELLPWVWWYGHLVTRSIIRNQIRAQLEQVERVTLCSLIRTLNHPPSHVRAVVAGMIHDGALVLVDYVPGAVDAVLEAPHA